MTERDFLASLKECDWDTKEEGLWIYVLGGCGCGSSDDFQALAWRVFETFAIDKEFTGRAFMYEQPQAEVVAHWLDSLGLIEHGSSLVGSWLSAKGQAVYDYLIATKP